MWIFLNLKRLVHNMKDVKIFEDTKLQGHIILEELSRDKLYVDQYKTLL